MRLGGILVAAAVIVITNGIVLIEVARNRAGVPIETIQLTERELPLNFREKENTGVAVRLGWQQRFYFVTNDYSWLDQTKLEGLGFDCARALREPKRSPLPRPAYVALEYGGPAWEQWLKAVQQANAVRNFSASGMRTEMSSRLFPVDVAKTPEPLLRKYPDREKYLIVEGVVALSVTTFDPVARQPGQARLQPSISEALPDTIHVPAPLSDALGNLTIVPNAASPRYTLTLSYGRHFEPWLVTSAPTQ
jgi:hypothetical protein